MHDVSDGGLAVALAEMAIAGGIGAMIDPAAIEGLSHAFFFGEDQARYVVTVEAADSETLMAEASAAGVPIRRLGLPAARTCICPGMRRWLWANSPGLHPGSLNSWTATGAEAPC